jgi:cytochrome c556
VRIRTCEHREFDVGLSCNDQVEKDHGHSARRRFQMIRGSAWGACLATVALAVTVGRAQPVFTAQDFERAMKAAGRHMGLARNAITAGDFEAAKMRVARTREQVFPTVTFWKTSKEPEAVKLLRDAVAALDDLDVSLSKEPADREGVRAAAAKVDAACQRCHTIYREQDPASNTFAIKRRR